jgi:hypothetical protein
MECEGGARQTEKKRKEKTEYRSWEPQEKG